MGFYAEDDWDEQESFVAEAEGDDECGSCGRDLDVEEDTIGFNDYGEMCCMPCILANGWG